MNIVIAIVMIIVFVGFSLLTTLQYDNTERLIVINTSHGIDCYKTTMLKAIMRFGRDSIIYQIPVSMALDIVENNNLYPIIRIFDEHDIAESLVKWFDNEMLEKEDRMVLDVLGIYTDKFFLD